MLIYYVPDAILNQRILTYILVLYTCPNLKLTSIWPVIGDIRRWSFCVLFCYIVEHGQGDDLGLFALICWSLWVLRNKMVFNDTKG